jgi:hypothetical protein
MRSSAVTVHVTPLTLRRSRRAFSRIVRAARSSSIIFFCTHTAEGCITTARCARRARAARWSVALLGTLHRHAPASRIPRPRRPAGRPSPPSLARPARCSGAPCGARPSPSSYADNGTSHEPYLKRGVPAAVEGDHRPLGWWAPFKRLPSPCPGRLRAWGRGHRLLGLDTPWAPCPGLAAVEAVWGCPPQGASGFPSIRSTAMQGRGQRRPAGGDFPGGRERRAARPGPSPAV